MRQGDKEMRRQGDREIGRQGIVGTRFASSFVLLLVFCLFGLSSSAVGYMLSIGHFPPLRNGRTVLLITDLSGSGPAVSISFYDELGREIPASPVHKLLPPRGKIQVDVENYLQTIGTIVLESGNARIMGEYWQINEDGAVFMLPFQRPGVEGRYFVNCFRFPSCNHHYLVLSDPSGSGPLVQMEFYSTEGELIKVASKLLRPHGTLAFEVNVHVPWDMLGKVSVRSFGGSIVFHYRQLCGSETVLAVPARLPARELILDEFSNDSGIAGGLVIADASAEGPAVKVQFRDSDGVVLYEREKLLSPNGVVQIEPVDYVNDIHRGTISISSEAKIIADYWERDPQTVLGTFAVEQAGRGLFVSHFSPFDGIQNLLSLLNVGEKPVNVEVQFYASNGRELLVEKIFLEPYKRVDKLVGSHFDGASTGTIIVECTDASLVVTSHIFDLENGRRLGRVHAQVIR